MNPTVTDRHPGDPSPVDLSLQGANGSPIGHDLHNPINPPDSHLKSSLVSVLDDNTVSSTPLDHYGHWHTSQVTNDRPHSEDVEGQRLDDVDWQPTGHEKVIIYILAIISIIVSMDASIVVTTISVCRHHIIRHYNYMTDHDS